MIDGDTVEVAVDLGMRITRTVRVRILGFDAPELFSGTVEERADGQRWKAALEEMVLGQQVYLRTEKDRTSFDRYLAHIWRASDGLYVALPDKTMMMGA
ncbi:MAG: hypothetical protein H0U59_07205 [Gemmatimonadaceae bacterium]|nr:hypothetical protein [Gemmatimonadaceae bacterium]